MTKAKTKGAKRRARANRITLPGGEVIEAPAVQGRRRDMEIDQPVALFARMRHAGLSDTPDNRREAASPMRGCSVGLRLIEVIPNRDERAALWDAVCYMRGVIVAYDAAFGAPRRHAQCLRILAPADIMHADSASPAVDIRTDEERYRSAVSDYMRLEGWLGYVDKPARSACLHHVIDEPFAPLSNWSGIYRALLCVADGRAPRPLIYRGA